MNGYKGDEKDRKLMIPVAAILMSVVALVGIGYATITSSVTSENNDVTDNFFTIDIQDTAPTSWNSVTTNSADNAFDGTLTTSNNKVGNTPGVSTSYDGTAYLKAFNKESGSDDTTAFTLKVTPTNLNAATIEMYIVSEGEVRGENVATATISGDGEVSFSSVGSNTLKTNTVYEVVITTLDLTNSAESFKLVFTATPSA